MRDCEVNGVIGGQRKMGGRARTDGKAREIGGFEKLAEKHK
jgi:hypothetical protein